MTKIKIDTILDIENINDIKMYKQSLKKEISLQEQILAEDFEDIKDRWSFLSFGHRSNNVKVNRISKAAGYISAGVVIVSKVIGFVNQGKKIYKQFNH